MSIDNSNNSIKPTYNYLDDLTELTLDKKDIVIKKDNKNKNVLKDKSNIVHKPGFLKGKF